MPDTFEENIGSELTTFYRERVVLVTGGCGAIGSNLTKALVRLGARVLVLDDLSSGFVWLLPRSTQVEFIQGSILDQQSLFRAFAYRPSVVFHLAALFANQNSIEHPETDLLVNGLGTLRILQYSVAADVSRVVFASSSSSLYHGARLPFDEDDVTLTARTPYQASKLLGELYCQYFQHQFGLSVTRARFFNSYGPGECPGRYRNVIPNFVYLARCGRPLPITGTGEETRDWTYVMDIIHGLLLMGYVDAASSEAINLGCGQERSVIEVAQIINRLTKNRAGVEFRKRRDWDTTSRRLASIAKAQRILGYKPQYTLEIGLEKVVQWFDEEWPKIEPLGRELLED
ncbi:MAG: NAD-dependent epimerase/dehydratase family protein [Armatimonadota bacterium]